MPSIYNKFIKDNAAFKDKWIDFIKNESVHGQLKTSDYREELTPFYGMKIFDSLSDDTKTGLFFDYIILVAEAQILLEQLLIFSFRNYRKKLVQYDDKIKAAFEKLALEELYHSRAFKVFLQRQSVFSWPQKGVFPRYKWLRSFLMWLMKFAPMGISLPGAKLEAFSLSYFHLLKRTYNDNHANSWVTLNHYHHIDESFHVPLEFDLYEDIAMTGRKYRSLVSTLMFMGLLQIILLTAAKSIIKRRFGNETLFFRVQNTLRFIVWAIYYMPAYAGARKIIKQQFKIRKIKLPFILRVLYK